MEPTAVFATVDEEAQTGCLGIGANADLSKHE